MLLKDIDYAAPADIGEACSLFKEAEDASYLAGGTDLLPQMRLGRRSCSLLVDLKRISGLGKITRGEGNDLSVGAAVSLAEIANCKEIREHYPVLAECCLTVGSYPLRNRATMAGNICNGSPAADTSAALLALDASVGTTGAKGERKIDISDFFKGPGMTALEKGELVKEIFLPKKSAGLSGKYLRLSRRKGVDLATVALLVGRHDGDNRGHRVCLIAVAPTPKRVLEAEAILDSEGYGETGRRRAVEAALDAASPIDDVRASAGYRREMVSVLAAEGIDFLSGKES